ncbi:MAG: flagellar filament capping protein FliD [Magnetococcales bacterium]|nr:flagellar filament capping protein FliD [Magnetococcales bacterium]
MALGSITFGGLASGLPPDIVDQLMSSQQNRLKAFQRDQSYYQNQQGAFSNLESLLTSLKSTAETLQSDASFTPHTATSSNEEQLTVSASSSASPGFHSVVASQLASYQTMIIGDGGTDGSSPGTSIAADATVTSADSTMGFNYNGNAYTVAVTTGDTLASIAEKINAVDYGTDDGITASTMYDGTGYRLVMTPKDSGAFTVDASGDTTASRIDTISLTTDLTFSDGITISAADFFNTDAGQGTKLTVDGLTNIFTSSNTVDDIIPGVTMELLTTGTTSVSVSFDKDTLKTNINSFIDGYNAVVSYIDSEKEGLFATESLARSVKSQLRSMLNQVTTNADGTDLTPYNTASSLGIEHNSSGLLTLDTTVLDSALSESTSAVGIVFTSNLDDSSNGTEGISYRFETLISNLTDSVSGALTGKQNGLDSRLELLEDRIDRENSRLEKVRERLTLQFANLEQMMNSMNGNGNAMLSALGAL